MTAQLDLFGGQAIEKPDYIETAHYRYAIDGKTLVVTHKRKRAEHRLPMRGVIEKSPRKNITARLFFAINCTKPNLSAQFFHSFMKPEQVEHEYQQLTGKHA